MLSKLKYCSLCGQCQEVCPVFAQTRLEIDGPRGRMSLIKSAAKGNIPAREILPSLERCLLCGRCARACPARVPVDKIILAWLDKNVTGNLRGNLFYSLLVRQPRIVDVAQIPLAAMNKALEYLPDRLRSRLPSLPEVAPSPFRDTSPAEGQGRRVALFGGCLATRFLPEIAEASVRSLRSQGYEVLTPSFVCCARPQYLRGDHKIASLAARRNLAMLAELQAEFVVTPCPACLEMIRSVWPELGGLNAYEKELAAGAARMACDINSLLAKNSALKPGASVFYWHQPCLADAQMSRDAMNMLGGSENFVNAGQNEPLCCGATLKKSSKSSPPSSDLAQKLGETTRNAIMAVGAAMVATSCPACILRLRHILDDHGDRVEVAHSVEIFAKSLKENQEKAD